MAKYKFDSKTGDFLFFCPGCDHLHVFEIPRWTFDGNLESPTFTPSLLCWVPGPNDTREEVCHLFLTNGRIHYLNDCHHSLAGKDIPLVDYFE